MSIKESYTHEDVKKLVDEANMTLDALKRGYAIRPCGGYVDDLTQALKPFLPDPEEELLEAMVMASCNGGMRAALAVVKERGWGPK